MTRPHTDPRKGYLDGYMIRRAWRKYGEARFCWIEARKDGDTGEWSSLGDPWQAPALPKIAEIHAAALVALWPQP